MCSRLNDNDESFVSLMGVYSTLEHPFALVFKFMDHLNLRGYLRNNRDIGRLEVVCFHNRICYFPLSHRLDASCWKLLVVCGVCTASVLSTEISRLCAPPLHSEFNHELTSF